MTAAAMLDAYRCAACGWLQFSSKHCDRCRGGVLGVQVEPTGKVVAITVLERVPPGVLCSAPYAVALVQPTGGPELPAVCDPADELRVADEVEIGRIHLADGEQSTWAWTARRPSTVR